MRRTFFSLLKLASLFWKLISLALLLGFAAIASSVGLLATSAYIIAFAALQPSIAELQLAIVGVRFFGISRGLFRYLERLVSHNVAFHLLTRIRLWFYQSLEPLAPARLMHFKSGDLLSRIVADIETLEQFFVRVISPPLVAVGISCLMWLFLGAFDTRLAAALLPFLLLAGAIVPLFIRQLSRGMGSRLIELRGSLNHALVDGIQGSADLFAYDQEEQHLEHVRLMSSELIHLQGNMARVSGLSSALSGLTMNMAMISVLMVSVALVGEGRLDGIFIAVLILAATASFEAVIPLPSTFQHLETNLAAAQRLFEVIDAKPIVQEPSHASPTPKNFTLIVENLCFSYEPGLPLALDGINFHLHEGGRLAIVGPSGAGKSTLVHLLLRFWDYDEGHIKLGGNELKAYHQNDLRQVISVVSQSTHLFNGTVRENLLLAHPKASEDDLIRAARQAQINEFINGLPHGYDTWIGEGGLLLSGGERQRLAIARALLKATPILILDEPTTNLDALTENRILHSLRMLMEGKSTLIITHRLVGLKEVDEILVLCEGRVVERGHHSDLIKDGGLYQRMWELQIQTDTIENFQYNDAATVSRISGTE
jgi:thiol reductant ABC exporter CydC subunit